MGADVTNQEPQPEATRANLLTILKQYGFNSIRLRTFVDPKAADGYDKQNGYADIAHTVAFGKQIVDAGMALLVDFHYSDNWADPGKQCVPIAWQTSRRSTRWRPHCTTTPRTRSPSSSPAGRAPAMVQIGNETTPGMLIHRCDSGGLPMGTNAVTGSISNWTNLGKLFKAGVAGVKEVDPDHPHLPPHRQGGRAPRQPQLHHERRNQGVVFDAFGESCYTAYQGRPSEWKSTSPSSTPSSPKSPACSSPSTGPSRERPTTSSSKLPNQRGIGTFNWAPTRGRLEPPRA